MSKRECFTCANKISRMLTADEREELQAAHVAKTGRKTLRIPEMGFTCSVTGKEIRQIDPACNDYSGDKVMEGFRFEISNIAGKLRKELQNG